MAPPVVNSEDPDGTEPDRETENEPVSAPSEPPLNIDSSQIESAAPTSQQVLEPQNQSVSDLTSHCNSHYRLANLRWRNEGVDSATNCGARRCSELHQNVARDG